MSASWEKHAHDGADGCPVTVRKPKRPVREANGQLPMSVRTGTALWYDSCRTVKENGPSHVLFGDVENRLLEGDVDEEAYCL